VENPYFHRTSIRDDRYFFGRTQETRRILSLVAREQPVSIVGPRRIGKSSILFHLCDPRVRAEHRLPEDRVCVRVDCQALSGELTKSDVYRGLVKAIGLTLHGRRAESSSQSVTYPEFEKYLDKITDQGIKITLLFDEFEAMAENHQLEQDFFNELRALCEAGKLSYVTASGATLFELSFHDKSIPSSPFFNVFTTVGLGFMELQEARAMVDGLAAMADFGGFDNRDYAFLQKIAGSHPFYLQMACYHLFEERAKGDHSAAPDYDRVKRQFAQETRDHFQYDWKRLSRDEQIALKLIGEGSRDTVKAGDLERLEQRCLVYQGESFSSVFAEFVIHEIDRASSVGSENTIEVIGRTGEKRQVKVTKPPLVITDEDLRRFGGN